MRQILQDLKSGKTDLAEIPAPGAGRGQVLIRSSRTLVSAGTERMLVEFGKAGMLGKARQQPEKVRQVLDKIRTDGLAPTLDAVFAKLNQPLPLGYCNVGRVLETGAGVAGFAPGDRVASNGKHAQAVAVPVNLSARVPDAVSDDEAAFTVLASIALQGVRLVQPTLGEAVVVTGLGLIGLVTVQLLRAHGCRVLGLDFDPERLAMAERFGAETVNLGAGADPLAAAERFSRGRGMDAVIITASTKSNEPMHQAAQMCRKRGRIVLVGVTGLELSRADFYEKELTFQVSCSYGPGRYDPNYEDKGQDYPVGFVRWTEQRNFEAVLDMMADGRLDVKPLISHRFALDQAEDAYALISGEEKSLGVLIDYPAADAISDADLARRTVSLGGAVRADGKAALGFVGSGNYAGRVLIPAFKEAGAHLAVVASSGGVSGAHAAKKHGFAAATTDTGAIFGDAAVNAVVIATRHDSHADYVCRALEAGKHVFVEKPLALTMDELERIETAWSGAQGAGGEAGAPVLTVGFNRRFSPHAEKMKALLAAQSAPKSFVMTVNAGAIPADHWTQDAEAGGGRIVGEACHFIDLLRFLAGAPIETIDVAAMDAQCRDTVTITLRFADGSIGTVHYFANGPKSLAKERLEAFCGGRVLQLDNFRKLTGQGWPGFKTFKTSRQDKGQSACAAAFVRAAEAGGAPPIAFDELMEVSRASILAAEAARG